MITSEIERAGEPQENWTRPANSRLNDDEKFNRDPRLNPLTTRTET
jgi:hypothetical protein